MKLKAGTHFFYLDFAKKIDTVDAGRWVWYKVTTSDKKKSGWIYGSPNDVEPLTDDNW
jgi:hypothetical protein